MLVKQKTNYDCVLACLTMVTGKKYSKLYSKKFVNKVVMAKGCSGDLLKEAFSKAGYTEGTNMECVYASNTDSKVLERLLWRRKAIIQVPSLNFEKGSHAIFWDGEVIQDPSTLQVYRWWNQLKPVYVWIFNDET